MQRSSSFQQFLDKEAAVARERPPFHRYPFEGQNLENESIESIMADLWSSAYGREFTPSDFLPEPPVMFVPRAVTPPVIQVDDQSVIDSDSDSDSDSEDEECHDLHCCRYSTPPPGSAPTRATESPESTASPSLTPLRWSTRPRRPVQQLDHAPSRSPSPPPQRAVKRKATHAVETPRATKKVAISGATGPVAVAVSSSSLSPASATAHYEPDADGYFECPGCASLLGSRASLQKHYRRSQDHFTAEHIARVGPVLAVFREHHVVGNILSNFGTRLTAKEQEAAVRRYFNAVLKEGATTYDEILNVYVRHSKNIVRDRPGDD
ncbi:hypothetical protein FB45DRAFT_139431 [Roridomyces roridus]|uniref:Uncharacterized protein n=1 Tax=Roridomyces roridus TaxID=1738132 RepID=A0AAD7FI59_9AGAR|nr:hypothetical protein FB45DRAFT_139431 [Roridomyces roridus]